MGGCARGVAPGSADKRVGDVQRELEPRSEHRANTAAGRRDIFKHYDYNNYTKYYAPPCRAPANR